MNIGKLTVIVGPMFSGKCMCKGTGIIMYDGSIKKIENIQIGDKLMGDDSTYKTVLNLNSGIGELFRVNSKYGNHYIVNNEHILTLKYLSNLDNINDYDIVDISINDFINLDKTLQLHYCEYKSIIEFPIKHMDIEPYIFGIWLNLDIVIDNRIICIWKRYCSKYNYLDKFPENKIIPDNYLLNSYNNRLKLLAGIIDSCNHNIKINNSKLSKQIFILINSLNIQYIVNEETIILFGKSVKYIPCIIKHNYSEIDIANNIDVEYYDIGEYFGFELDGNGRFLLDNYVVTHNSSELQRQIRRLLISGKQCLIIKHSIDNRYNKSNECCTHDMQTMSAITTIKLFDVIDICKKYDVIGIDEGQFFSDIIEFVDCIINKYNKIVIVAALDGTYEGKPFGRISELLSQSESFTKLTAVCRYCGNDASFTIRKQNYIDKTIEIVGGADIYEAICRNCRSKIN